MTSADLLTDLLMRGWLGGANTENPLSSVPMDSVNVTQRPTAFSKGPAWRCDALVTNLPETTSLFENSSKVYPAMTTEHNCEYVRRYYGVPAEIGVRVVVRGKPGIIASDRGHYIGVNFDHHKPGHISNVHPTDEVQYGEMGTIRQMTRSQRRYVEYLRVAECFQSFRHYLTYIQNR
jgi:hypothetical protein